MKILVTGGSGFIGSYVIENLLSKGHKVIAFDHKKHNSYPEGVEIFLGDTRDYTAVSEAVAISDGVIHLAGVLGTQETVNEPIPAVETNIIGGLNIFKAVRHYKIPAVYIAVGNYWMNNSYSISKTTAERFAYMFNKEHGTKIAVVRGLNVYGPRQKSWPVRKIMPNLVIPALKNERIQIYGDGEQKMDMIYAKDIAEILVRALLVDHGIYDKPFEAGTGQCPSVNEITDLVLKIAVFGDDPHPIPEHLEMRPGETDRSIVVGDPETLRPLFDGQLPEFTPLETGIRETVEWYRKNI